MTLPHKSAVNQTILRLADEGVWAWEHKTGTAWLRYKGGARPVKYGLPGSPDIIGIVPVLITADMVGETIGQFVGVEVKVGRDRQSEKQKRFGDRLVEYGARFSVERVG